MQKLSDALKIIETLEKYGISYQSYSEPFESGSSVGKMHFQIMAVISEFERQTISENVKMGMCAKAKAGEWCGGIPPLGYIWVPMEGTEHGGRRKSRLAIDEKEAKTVRHIFELYVSGKGYKAIVNQINKEGYKTKKGNEFSVAQIKTILTNPVYIGKVRFNVRRDWNEKRRHNINPNPIIEEGIHDAIIEDELWDKVQFIIEQKSGKPSRIYDGEYPLTGILRCPVCGAGMVISRTTNTLKDGSKRRIEYYACGNWKNKGTAVCSSNSIRVEKANAVVFKELENLFTNEKILKSVLKRVNENNQKQIKMAESKLKVCETELKETEKKKERIFEAYENGIFTSEEFMERKKALNTEYDRIRSEKEEYLMLMAQEHRNEIPYEVVKGLLQNFGKLLSSDKIERGLKKQLLHMVIKEITIDERREINSIKIHLTDSIIKFLSDNDGGTPDDGVPPNLFLKKVEVPSFDIQIEI